MEIFLSLFAKILPLYAMVLLGYGAGKYFEVKMESIAPLLIYFIAPLVVFNGVATAQLDASIILLPLVFFMMASVIGTFFYFFAGKIWKGGEQNVMGFTAGTGNTGYFGLPVILALLGAQQLPIAVLSVLGFLLYENSVGYFFVARGKFATRDALLKVAKLPTLYAFIAGILWLALHFTLSDTAVNFLQNFRGAYTVLGMMLVGLGLAGVTVTAVDWKFLLTTFFAKFIVWPFVAVLFVVADIFVLHLFASTVYPIMLILSVVPLASNTVAFAAQLNVVPEKAAFAVLASTLFALLYIPLFMAFIYPLVLGQ